MRKGRTQQIHGCHSPCIVACRARASGSYLGGRTQFVRTSAQRSPGTAGERGCLCLSNRSRRLSEPSTWTGRRSARRFLADINLGGLVRLPVFLDEEPSLVSVFLAHQYDAATHTGVNILGGVGGGHVVIDARRFQ